MSADHVILGVISMRPSSGYDIKEEIEQGGAGLLSGVGFGSIYPALKQLEREGLITTQEADVGSRKRQVHELTAHGWHSLESWLAQPPEYPIPTRDELLLKMVFWASGRPDDRATLISHLRLRRQQSQALLERLVQWPKNGYSYISEHGMLVITCMRARLDAELAWIDATIAQLEGPPQPPAQDPRGLAPAHLARRAAALAQVSATADPADDAFVGEGGMPENGTADE